MPARVAIAMLSVAVSLARVRRDNLQEVECRHTVSRDFVPEPVIATGPEQPHVTPLYLFGRHGHAIVHVVKKVLLCLRETRWGTAGALRLVRGGGGRGLRAGYPKYQGRRRDNSHESSGTSAQMDCLHDRFLASEIRRQRICGRQPTLAGQ